MSIRQSSLGLGLRMWLDIRKPLREAVYLTLLSCVFGLFVNSFIHPHPIELFATQAYQTLVPCPESGAEVKALSPAEALQDQNGIFVDARSKEDFETWHVTGAFHLAYDYLEATDEQKLDSLTRALSASGKKRVIVYGDGGNPDSGEYLGKEIAAYGINNVFYVQGGADALVQQM